MEKIQLSEKCRNFATEKLNDMKRTLLFIASNDKLMIIKLMKTINLSERERSLLTQEHLSLIV